jgi:hypothetical protein
MKQLCVAALIAAAPAGARADTIYGNQNEPGRITAIEKGVWELDVGGLAVLSRDQEGDASVSRFTTDFSAGVQYYVKRNVSVGVVGLFDYENAGGGVRATTGGAAVQSAINLRLGLGAFFRPTLGVGALFGSRKSPTATPGMLVEASQVGFVTRLQLPVAYFTSHNWVLQAGPQINLLVGSYTPTGGMAQSFTRIAGGFAIGLGRAF